jgi:hypothetical protein
VKPPRATVRRTPRAAVVLALAAAACLTSCVRVPDTGPVVETNQSAGAVPVQNPDNNPPPPQAGAAPADIVTGFLDAMTATPLRTGPALQFLTAAGQDLWKPQRVVLYGDHRPPRGTGTVTVRLIQADQVGTAGEWLGRLGPGASRVSFPMRQEDGEWRIAAAPNALLVPRTFYEQNFTDASLFFFDPTGRILVPEVVHVPQGQQLTTSLMHALLLGPLPSLTGVARTYIPPGLSAGPVVVTNGRADVTLRGPDPGPMPRRTTVLLLAQLSWTLRQDPSVTSFEVSINGRALTDASGSSTFRADGLDRYDPAVPLGSSQLYALRHGRLVSGRADQLTPVGGPFGAVQQGIGPFAVSLDDNLVAGTTPDALLLGPVRGSTRPQQVLSGTGLLRPAWDFAGRLWEVQNPGRGGAVVLYLSHGRRHVVRVPGVTGADVQRFLVSRDGSRLVAVVRGRHADRLVVSRLLYNAAGRSVAGTRARAVRWSTAHETRIRDIGWTSPTTIAVLYQVSGIAAEVRTLDVDGSTSPTEAAPLLIRGRVTSLATSPAGQTPFAVQRGQLFDISQVDTTHFQPFSHLRHITYAG